MRGFFVVALAGCLAGCAGGGPEYEYAPVAGKVTLDGKPLAGVIVKFYPVSESSTQRPWAMGTTDENGVYRLSTGEDKPGAMVGPHLVVVRWPARDRGVRPSASEPPIPPKFTVVTQSPLRFEVKAGAGQTIDLPLLTD